MLMHARGAASRLSACSRLETQASGAWAASALGSCGTARALTLPSASCIWFIHFRPPIAHKGKTQSPSLFGAGHHACAALEAPRQKPSYGLFGTHQPAMLLPQGTNRCFSTT